MDSPLFHNPSKFDMRFLKKTKNGVSINNILSSTVLLDKIILHT